jgi:hypothetical protein
MTRHLIRLFVALAMASVSAGAAPKDQQPQRPPHRFMLGLKVQTNSEFVDGKMPKQDSTADMEIGYRWESAAGERSLFLESVALKITGGGKTVMDYSMTSEKVVQVTDGQRKEITAEKGPQRIKEMLRDLFGSPIVKVQLDAAGTEVSRKVVATPAAVKAMGDDGLILGILLMNPEPPQARKTFETKAELRSANERMKGRAKYTRKENSDTHKLTYAATGTLVAAATADDAETAKEGDLPSCVVTGEQTYDVDQREWTSGKLDMDLSLRMVENKRLVARIKGTMTVTLEPVSEKR